MPVTVSMAVSMAAASVMSFTRSVGMAVMTMPLIATPVAAAVPVAVAMPAYDNRGWRQDDWRRRNIYRRRRHDGGSAKIDTDTDIDSCRSRGRCTDSDTCK